MPSIEEDINNPGTSYDPSRKRVNKPNIISDVLIAPNENNNSSIKIVSVSSIQTFPSSLGNNVQPDAEQYGSRTTWSQLNLMSEKEIPIKKRRLDNSSIIETNDVEQSSGIQNVSLPDIASRQNTSVERMIDSLELKNIKKFEKKISNYERNGSHTSTQYDVDVKTLNMLKNIRETIFNKHSRYVQGKYHCIVSWRCNSKYIRPNVLIRHIITHHKEIVSRYSNIFTEKASTLCRTSDDADSLITCDHSISSEITLNSQGNRPAVDITRENEMENDDIQIICEIDLSKEENDLQTSTSSVQSATTSNNIMDQIDNETIQSPREQSPRRINEIDQYDNLWGEIDISFTPRKNVNWLGKRSFELYELHNRKIRSIIQHRRTKNVPVNKNIVQRKRKAVRVKGSDEDASLKYFMLHLMYTNDELSKIEHCINNNRNFDDLCDDCRLALMYIQAQQYSRSKQAFEQYQKIVNDRYLTHKQKREKLKDLIDKKDEYKLIRDRLQKIRDKRGGFNQVVEVVEYNRNYFLWLDKALNDKRIQMYVGINLPPDQKFDFGIYCSKLMDDIVNEFLARTTVTCMNFAYHDNKVNLTNQFLTKYQALFKMTNKEATYLEPPSLEIRGILEREYTRSLPKTTVLEILIIDCLLRQTFTDEDTIHANLDSLIFEHLKSPQPVFKFLMYMKFSRDYLVQMNKLLLRFLFQLTVEVLKLKKINKSDNFVRFSDLIEACEVVGVFGSSYTRYLKNAYKGYEEEAFNELIRKGYKLCNDGVFKRRGDL